MKLFFLLLLTALFPGFASNCFLEKISSSKSGDYVVMLYDNNSHLLFVRSKEKEQLILEEVVTSGTKSCQKDWQEWINKGAIGALSWTTYTIDLKNIQLVNAYSFTKSSWLYLEEGGQILKDLMKLDLEPVFDSDRRKIGPEPLDESADTRAVWNPPKLIEGKKVSGTTFSVWTGKWPKDLTPLSECRVDLFFDETRKCVFPDWVDFSNGYMTHHMRAISSGEGMLSSKKSLPKK